MFPYFPSWQNCQLECQIRGSRNFSANPSKLFNIWEPFNQGNWPFDLFFNYQFIFLNFGDQGIRLYESEKDQFTFIEEMIHSSNMSYTHFCFIFGEFITQKLLDFQLGLINARNLRKETVANVKRTNPNETNEK
jgi:hypothetical protein